jgi:hypothetical protein
MNRDEITGAAASAVDRLAQTGRETYQDVKTRAVDAASQAASAAKAEALGRAETAKDTIADEGRRLADSLRSASQGGDDSVQAKVLNVVADSVADLSESLRGRSFEELLSQAQGFARRNPGAFVAAAALAGFALARFARASAPQADVADGYGTDGYGMSGQGMGSTDMGGSTGMSSTGTGGSTGMGGSPGGSAGGFGEDAGRSYGAAGVSTSSLTTHDAGFGLDDDLGSDTAGDLRGDLNEDLSDDVLAPGGLGDDRDRSGGSGAL